MDKIPTWAWVVGAVAALMYFKPKFLGSTWDTTLDGLVGTVQSLINALLDVAKANPIVSAVIVIALVFILFGKR